MNMNPPIHPRFAGSSKKGAPVRSGRRPAPRGRAVLWGFLWAVLWGSPDPARGEEPRPTETISQYGIAWTLDRPVLAGRYVTGDWWVVGPVIVTAVAPAPAPGRNGSAVNPPAGAAQGYDDRMSGYDAKLRAEFPLELKPGQSLVSVASLDKVGDRTPDTVPRQYARGPLRTAVVLTCVEAPPEADAFRPAYVGDWRETFRVSQLRRERLPRLPPPGGELPGLAGLDRMLERIWLDHQREWANRAMHPLENMPDYGRDITNVVADTALRLLLDDPDGRYETLLLRFVQKGIDYYGVVQSDANLWIANGGHNSGRKLPILFAGILLDHEGMMNVKATFQEDQQTYYGPGFRGQKALWRISLGNPNTGHEEVDPATWETFGRGDNNGKKAEGYRKLNGPTWVGQALAVRLLGAEELWNHPPFFDYVDRWCAEEGDKAAAGLAKAMWETYRAKADEIGAALRRKRTAQP